LYQWTAIDECTRYRFVYGFEEHTPENSVKFLKMLQKAFPFKIQTAQTDNGTEFTYKFISDETPCPFDTALEEAGVAHKLIPPRRGWKPFPPTARKASNLDIPYLVSPRNPWMGHII
jgi:hypothetical protein